MRQYSAEGTFEAFRQHLPRLRDMGVEILWFMPITPISIAERQGTLGSYYACSTYTDVNPEFGTIADFKTLVAEAQELGFRVIIDWVANHTGYDHHWTEEHPDWYKKDEQGRFMELNGWADVIDLDYHNQDMRQEMIRCMRFWLETCNIDGFRCDMAHLVPLDFWEEARKACEQERPLFWLAESDVLHYHQVFDATYCWHWMHVTEKYARGKASLDDVHDILQEYNQYPPGSQKLFFTTNHDENSWNGTEYEKYGRSAQALAVFTATWPGLPLIYSGQELPNHQRLKFFDHDPIHWTAPVQLHSFYQTLLQLRKRNTALHFEGVNHTILNSCNDKVFSFVRFNGKDAVLVVLNLSADSRVQVAVDHQMLQGNYRNVFSGFSFRFGRTVSFELDAGEYVVYEKKGE